MQLTEYHTLPNALNKADTFLVSVRFVGDGLVPKREVSLGGVLSALSVDQRMTFDEHPGMVIECDINFVAKRVKLLVQLEH